MRWKRYTGLSAHRKRLELASTRWYLCPSRQCALRHWVEGHHSAVRFRVRTNGIWTILGISTTVPGFWEGTEVPGLSLRVIDSADVELTLDYAERKMDPLEDLKFARGGFGQ
jgi:hypothetical protein